jgi:hypothetical protein
MTNQRGVSCSTLAATLGLWLLPISCVDDSETGSSVASRADGGPTLDAVPSDPADDEQTTLPATPSAPTTDAATTKPPANDAQPVTAPMSECPKRVNEDFEGACEGEASCWYPEGEACVPSGCYDIGYQLDCVNGEWQLEYVHYDGVPSDWCDGGNCDGGSRSPVCEGGDCDAGKQGSVGEDGGRCDGGPQDSGPCAGTPCPSPNSDFDEEVDGTPCVGNRSCWFEEGEACISDSECYAIGYDVECRDGSWWVDYVHYDPGPSDPCDGGDCDAGL